MYASHGRPSIAPERLLRAQLIQMLYTVRSERLLVEQIRYNLLFRWFIGLGMDEAVWDATAFGKNRDRLLEHEISRHFFQAVVAQAQAAGLMSDEHFTVDGTFLEAWASQKSFKPKDGSGGNDANQSGGRNPTVDFKGQTRSNDTHASVTDPDARLTTRQRRRKDTPPDTYEYMGMDVTATFTVVHPEANGQPKRTEVVQVPARAVRVFSTGLLRTKVSTLKRIRIRDQRAATVFMRDAHKRAFACEEDAKRAARRDVEAQRRTTLDLEATVIHHRGAYARGRGRPPKEPEPGIEGPHWRIRYTIVPVADAVATKRLHVAATFVVIRTKTVGWDIPDAEMIRRYKGQYHNEHGFAWLKSGAALNPIYLKTPHRIASLGFTYCIGLMVWALIQRSVRSSLREKGQKLPYHRGRQGDNITTRFIFELFQNVQSQHQVMPDGSKQYYIHGMNDHTNRACRALGTRLSVFRPAENVA